MQCYPLRPIKYGPIHDYKFNEAGNLVIVWEFEKGNIGETEIAGPVPENELPGENFMFLDLGHMTDWMSAEDFTEHYEQV